MSTVTLKQAIDEAQYVEYLEGHTFAVWHGGHTVNFYQENIGNSTVLEVYPTHSISVGDFSTNEVSIEEVKEGIQRYK